VVREDYASGLRILTSASSVSRQTETLDRGPSTAITLVGHNDQFKCQDLGQFDDIVLDFSHRTTRAKIPLLSHNLSEATISAWRPPQDEFLGTGVFNILENQGDVFKPVRLIEKESDDLSS